MVTYDMSWVKMTHYRSQIMHHVKKKTCREGFEIYYKTGHNFVSIHATFVRV